MNTSPPLVRQTEPIIQFFKPTEAELENIIQITCRMRKTFADAGFPEGMANKMVWLWWESVMKPSLELE